MLDKDGHSDHAFAELKFQSDVNSSRTSGKLLVDDPKHRQNAKLWVEILRFRQRMNGFQGMLDVWHGMRRRDIDLPVSGSEAEILWTTSIHAGITAVIRDDGGRRQFLSEVFKYAQDLKARSGSQFEGLYKSLVGRMLRVRLPEAMDWHSHLCHTGFARPSDIRTVAVDAMSSVEPFRAFRVYAKIYQATDSRDLYDSCIDEALQIEGEYMVLQWHRLFIKNGDGPSTEMFSRPAVQRLFALDKDKSLPMKGSRRNRESERKDDADKLRHKLPSLTRQSMNIIVGDVHGIKPKEISDSFCARLFATRAFSIDLVLKGLSFLGIETLGPLAIREMALRAGSPLEFSNQIGNLKDNGLKFGDSVFIRIVTKLANEGQSWLWTALLESDQHPEVYDDPATQEALLTSFLEQQKWNQAHVALIALSFTASSANLRAWNRLLQHYIIHREYRSLLSTMQSVQSQGLPLTLYSLQLLRRHILPERRRTKRPVQGQGSGFFDPLEVVRNACVHTAESGHFVPANLWTELLKRYGMAHRWGATERLVLWLFDHYSSRRPANEDHLVTHTYVGRRKSLRTLRWIFSSVMLQALFTWGFRSQSVRKSLRPHEPSSQTGWHEPWAQGLALLHALQARKLFDISLSAKKAFQQRMWTLFGAGYSTLGVNNEARRVNRMSLSHYIKHANNVWGGLVDWVDPMLLGAKHQNNPRLLVEFFGPVYRTNRNVSEYANVGAWANALGKMGSSHYYQAAGIRAKKQAWERSRFRFIRPTRLLRRKCYNRGEVEKQSKAGNQHHKVLASTGANVASHHPLQEHRSPSARSESLHPPPNLIYTREHP